MISNTIPDSSLIKFTTFGDLLRFLRRRVGLTQLEFASAVGYSDSQISRLEQNMRLPDPLVIEVRFIPILQLEKQPGVVVRLLELASNVRREDAPALGMSPYKGLDYFDESDADLFVGREALTEKLLVRVLSLVSKRGSNQDRVFTIVGASGSGKSSLVRAGLVPGLRWNKISASWPIHILTPTAHPLENLASTLTTENASVTATAVLMDDMLKDPRSLNLYIKRLIQTTDQVYFLLVIDQFEELFSLCNSEEERSAFIANLMTSAQGMDGHAIIIITLRSDFYTYCAGYPQLRQALAAHQEFIGRMSTDEMRRSIEEPAARGHWELDPDLADLILHDVGQEPGALPLLSHALLETWQRRHGRTMTLSGYISAGGVRGAIAETAQAVFTDQLNTTQQAIAQRIFLRLVELGDESTAGDTRRRMAFEELVRKPDEIEDTKYVLKTLTDARLVTTNENSIQVAHEALIREWPTLRGWLEENRDGLRLHRQLTTAAQEWINAGQQSDLLYRGSRLAQIQEWSVSNIDELNDQEQDFLKASIAFSERELAERNAQQQRELEAAQKLANLERRRAEEGVKSGRRLRTLLILLGSVGVLVVLLAIFATLSWKNAASQAAINLSANLTTSAQQANLTGQGDLALALALQAMKVSPESARSLSVLRSIALGPGSRSVIDSGSNENIVVSLSLDGKKAISGSCASFDAQNNCVLGEVALWDLGSGRPIRLWTAHAGRVTAVTYSANGQSLITGGEDGTILHWDIDGNYIQPLIGHREKITALVGVPGTDQVLSGSVDGYVLLFELSSGNVLQRFQISNSPVTALGISADGLQAVSGYQDGSIKMWTLASREPISLFPAIGADISAVAINPDKSWILYTDRTFSHPGIYRLNIMDGSVIDQLKLDCVPGKMELNSAGTDLYITCGASLLHINVQNWSIKNRFIGNGEAFNAISISRDGRLGITGANDSTLRYWNLVDQLDYRIETVTGVSINSLAITPDGKRLVFNDLVLYGMETPAFYDIIQQKVVKSFFGGAMVFQHGGIAASPDGRFIAATGQTKSNGKSQVALWDLENESLVCIYKDYPGNATDIIFSPDSKYLLIGIQVSADKKGQLILYDVATCKEVRTIESSEDIASLAFNADGSRVITGSEDSGVVTLWDLETGKELRRYSFADRSPVWAVAFGPGDTSVLGSGWGEIIAWDVETTDPIQRYTGLSTYPLSMSVSPDSKYVLSGTRNGELILWDYVTGEELHHLNTNLAISSVLFSLDSKSAYAATLEGKIIEVSIDEKPYPELLDWITANRYVRDLTCVERQLYHVEDQCKP